MKLSDIAEKLSLKAVFENYNDADVQTVYTGDLLSDVMGHGDDECVIVTIQAHKNTLAVATLKDSPAIILCNNRPVPEDMIEAAKEEGVALFVTKENQFTVSGKLYGLLES